MRRTSLKVWGGENKHSDTSRVPWPIEEKYTFDIWVHPRKSMWRSLTLSRSLDRRFSMPDERIDWVQSRDSCECHEQDYWFHKPTFARFFSFSSKKSSTPFTYPTSSNGFHHHDKHNRRCRGKSIQKKYDIISPWKKERKKERKKELIISVDLKSPWIYLAWLSVNRQVSIDNT